MNPALKSLLFNIAAVALVAVAVFFFAGLDKTEEIREEHIPFADITATTTLKQSEATTTKEASESKPPPPSVAKAKPVAPPAESTVEIPAPPPVATQNGERDVYRILNPYLTEPKSFTEINEMSRAALVNIYCSSQTGSVRPISASGILIDPRGVILTNAHVAQYILLASDPRVNLSCVARMGSPARAQWRMEVLYLPPIWIEENADNIRAARPTGTGKYDYALLRITQSVVGSPVPESGLPYLVPDVRDAIGFTEDPVLVVSYPAEFLAGLATQAELYPVTTITTIKELLTFGVKSVDAISVGGVIGAQSGSSGGGIVNAWARLIGILTTTSEGETTSERDLRGITLSYIDRDLKERSGSSILETLSGNLALHAQFYRENQAPQLIQILIDNIRRR